MRSIRLYLAPPNSHLPKGHPLKSNPNSIEETMAEATNKTTTTAAYFRNHEDAHRAVLELREVEFPASAIGAAFREGISATHPAPSILEPEVTTETVITPKTTDPLLPPETPMTTLTGGSPFGEASTYRTPPLAGEDWWEGMRVALPHPASETRTRSTKPHQARRIAEPNDINFEPADRPAPAYDNDYQTGDYSYETHTFDPTTLAATLTSAGLDSGHASVIAQHINPGESIVTVTTTDRTEEARSILTRNNGVITYPSGEDAVAFPDRRVTPPARGGDLRLYGEILRCHTMQ